MTRYRYPIIPSGRIAKAVWHSKNLAGLFICYQIARQFEALIFTIIHRISQ